MRADRKQILWAVAGAGAIILLLAGVKFFQISKAIAGHKSFSPPPEAVTSIIAAEQEWPRTYSAVGSLNASQGASLSAQSPGEVKAIHFESGETVKKDQILVELDASVEEAQLKAAIATRDRWVHDLSRAEALRRSSVNSQSELEAAMASAHEAQAIVTSLEATILRKRVVAPFDGRAGIRAVNVGQYVNPGDAIVPLYVVDPLFIDFTLPQQAVENLSTGIAVNIAIDTYPGELFEGRLTAINPQIDITTRNVQVQATIANRGERLRPGMFAEVSVVLPQTDKVIGIPGSSISYAPYGDTVYVIEKMKDPTGREYTGVRQQVVTLGRSRGNQVAVLSGITAGQEIVTSGTFKLRPGAAIAVNNNFAPSNNPDPKPEDS